jgi:hypothetical protein
MNCLLKRLKAISNVSLNSKISVNLSYHKVKVLALIQPSLNILVSNYLIEYLFLKVIKIIIFIY